MPTSIAAIHPPAPAHRPVPGGDEMPDLPEYAFSDLWQDKKAGMTFGDVLDIINPLQHIPVVSSIYRVITGDTIGVGARLAGGALFGGPFGAIGASAIALVEGASGRTLEQHVAALFEDGPGEGPAAPQLAGDPPAAPEPSATGSAGAAAVPEPEGAKAAPQAVATVPPAPVAAAQPAPAAPAASAAAQARPASLKTPQDAPVDTPAERQRIAQAIEQARRAQAGLLLANIEADRAVTARPAGRDNAADAAAPDSARDSGPAQPFRTHPYLLPPGAPPQLISRAMEQALQRYEAMLQQRNAGAAAPVR